MFIGWHLVISESTSKEMRFEFFLEQFTAGSVSYIFGNKFHSLGPVTLKLVEGGGIDW